MENARKRKRITYTRRRATKRSKKASITNRHLPEDLVDTIMNYLSPRKAVELAAVCTTWNAATERHNPCNRATPWLLVPSSATTHTAYMLSIVDGDRAFTLTHPAIRGARCLGSSHGWLLLARLDPANESAGKNLLFMLNPFSGARLDLPPWTTGFESLRPVLQVLHAPTSKECMVLGTHGRCLLFCSPGAAEWTSVKQNASVGFLTGVVAVRGLYYGVNASGHLWTIEFKPVFKATRAHIHPYNNEMRRGYLVESRANLLFVQPEMGNIEFRVFEVDPVTLICTEKMSLDGRALFVGPNCSVAVEAAAKIGCRADCIYFIHGLIERRAWRVYDMKTQRSTNCCDSDSSSSCPTHSHRGRVWITPSAT